MNRSTRLCWGAIAALCILALWACGDDATNSSDSDTADLAVTPDTVKKIEVGNKLIAVLYNNGAIEKTSIDFQFSPIPRGTYEDVAISNKHVCLIAKKSKKLTCYKIETTLGALKGRKPPIDDVAYSNVWAGNDYFCATKKENEQLVCWGSICGTDGSSCWDQNLQQAQQPAAEEPVLQTIPENATLPQPALPNALPVTITSRQGNSNFRQVVVIGAKILSFSSNGTASCYVNHFGAVDCFGRDAEAGILDGYSQLSTDMVQVAVAKLFACALQKSGEIVCWGSTATPRTDAGPGDLGGDFYPLEQNDQFTTVWSGSRIVCGKSLSGVRCEPPDLVTLPAQQSQEALNFTSFQGKLNGTGTFGMPHSSLHHNFCLADTSLKEISCFINNETVPWQNIKGKDIRKGIVKYVNTP